ncbi:[citrate (pro-3S)-lyase] ligase [Desulfosporosinus sp. PR]|uniref:[citrate (pro-3S)-lyase] ligase n=1 Tax=Candidatus Desulfosporosinus nitrosoreducens TaxID=3401928 RepID=UPI0027F424F2|nr:[citrate (pro-3S)-lyase] ligase [Desulfosporosinus sp. PR]MDQ7093888.1 [citrate (pro-3S)-lyase] ligase [Desulfosporosinus sp. PR]
MYEHRLEWVNLNNLLERREVETFLQGFDLILDRDVDYTVAIRDESSALIATCSKARNVLKCFAVAKEHRGEGITSVLISALIDKLFSQGIYHSFIFTKPANVHIFTNFNFKPVHTTSDVALLENGLYDITSALEAMKKSYNLGETAKTALVMNCNPFTLGHQYLIEEAARNSREVLVFVVEENQSLFPFAARYAMVVAGTEHLKNVKVLPSGEYIISSATFPSYFLKEEGERLKAYTELDAAIFGRYFCKLLNITKRYVGEEPYCQVTQAYNKALQGILPGYGVQLQEVKRKLWRGVPISATKVRELLKEGNGPAGLEVLKELLPEVTLRFLDSNLGKEIIEGLRRSPSPC